MSIAEDHHLCELCQEFRAKEPREWGVTWVDNYWACAFCKGVYLHNLAVGRGKIHAARS